MKSVSLLLVIVTMLISVEPLLAQYSSKKVMTKHDAYTDSIKSTEYNRIFPILGSGAYKKGFDIPYPIGVMVNYFVGQQGIVLEDMKLGFTSAYNDSSNLPLTDISDNMEFGENSNFTQSVNVRPDIWILPFLNIYGIFGIGNSKTDVMINSIKVDDQVLELNINSNVDQSVTTAGFGVMGAAGLGPVWLSVDANFTWNKPELVEKSTYVSILGLRMGHTFTFKSKPTSNIGVWIGGMRLKMQTETAGAIKMADALPGEFWSKKDSIVGEYNSWFSNLTPAQQAIMEKTTIHSIFSELETHDGESTVHYSMNKQTAQLWNGIIGLQYQINKSWMIRTEGGIIGDRKSFLLSLNYRFLGPKRRDTRI